MISKISRYWPTLPAASLSLLLLTACAHETAIAPPQIHYGQDACASCGMTIDDSHFTSAVIYRAPSGPERVAIFDDIGCMLAWQHEHTGNHTITAFVHDYKTGQWIDAARAWYVRSKSIQTPMGWGIAAGETQSDVESAAKGEGLKVMNFDELWSTAQNNQGAAK